jgi:Fe-S-cluster-containing hydrogenase component 2
MSQVPSAFEFPIIPRGDDEGLFSRDIDGQLLRLDKPTESDFGKSVTLQIDGKKVTVKLAKPLQDAQGNDVLDDKGRPKPRYTTIYDAALELCDSAGPEARMSIPTLCHKPHMHPVAVCRLCVVQIYGQKHGKRTPERKLLPACQHQVKDGMEVFTMHDPGEDGERVRRVVTVLTDLLSFDHLKPAPPPAPAEELAPYNELKQAADRLSLAPDKSRFKLEAMAKSPHPTPRRAQPPTKVDDSSPVFVVDHSACILCDRCSRACDEVKENHIIGRTGKGAGAGMGFDLGVPMGDSGCVQCGECMVSCPTSAITFKRDERVAMVRERSNAEVVTVDELKGEPMFADVPPKFLLWQQGLVLRRGTTVGQELCRQGDAGNTAFLLRSGRVKIAAYAQTSGITIRGKGRGKPVFEREIDAAEARARWLTEQDAPPPLVGEMACLSGTARIADLVVLAGGEVWEMRRNVLDRAMRSPAMRARIEKMFRERTLDAVLRLSDMLKSVPADEQVKCIDFLRQRLEFLRASPGQVLFEQGDASECLYLLRLGHLKVEIDHYGGEPSVIWRGPGAVIGEIGLLGIKREDASRTNEDVMASLEEIMGCSQDELPAALPAEPHTATCTALDHVEMARVRRTDFLTMARQFPAVRHRLVETALARLRHDRDERPAVREFVEQGLYQAQSLLALDLDNCTRCDECTRACVDQHGTHSHGAPITRLFRDGLRFGNYLVATSCRSCKEAYCMVGCPVDAIHRGKHQQIVIEDHCIGCTLCAKNCPYGNIAIEDDLNHMMTIPDGDAPGGVRKVAKCKASVCDLCDAKGLLDEPLPRCVYACPHDAAHRMTGEEILNKVMAP